MTLPRNCTTTNLRKEFDYRNVRSPAPFKSNTLHQKELIILLADFLKHEGSRAETVVPIKADLHIACRAHAVPLPCREAKGLECVFPI
jgi:hypothetical protein